MILYKKRTLTSSEFLGGLGYLYIFINRATITPHHHIHPDQIITNIVLS